jgi:hypothetical protein
MAECSFSSLAPEAADVFCKVAEDQSANSSQSSKIELGAENATELWPSRTLAGGLRLCRVYSKLSELHRPVSEGAPEVKDDALAHPTARDHRPMTVATDPPRLSVVKTRPAGNPSAGGRAER